MQQYTTVPLPGIPQNKTTEKNATKRHMPYTVKTLEDVPGISQWTGTSILITTAFDWALHDRLYREYNNNQKTPLNL